MQVLWWNQKQFLLFAYQGGPLTNGRPDLETIRTPSMSDPPNRRLRSALIGPRPLLHQTRDHCPVKQSNLGERPATANRPTAVNTDLPDKPITTRNSGKPHTHVQYSLELLELRTSAWSNRRMPSVRDGKTHWKFNTKQLYSSVLTWQLINLGLDLSI
jgi:hypothetical protein